MKQLVQKIKDWGEDRNIISEVEAEDQAGKVLEEIEETYDAIQKNDIYRYIDLSEEVKDGIGDVVVTLILLAEIIKNDNDNFQSIDWEEDYRDRIIRLLTVSPINNINNLFLNHGEWLMQEVYAYDVYREIILDLYGFCQLLAKKRELTVEGCLEYTYDEIKDRQGKIKEDEKGNKTFVKEE